jgi:hypothetical protein
VKKLYSHAVQEMPVYIYVQESHTRNSGFVLCLLHADLFLQIGELTQLTKPNDITFVYQFTGMIYVLLFSVLYLELCLCRTIITTQ